MKKTGYNLKYFRGICAKDTTVRNTITGLEEIILIVVVYEIFPNDTGSMNYTRRLNSSVKNYDRRR